MNWSNMGRTAQKFEEDCNKEYKLLRIEGDKVLPGCSFKFNWEWFKTVYWDFINNREVEIWFPDVIYEEIRVPVGEDYLKYPQAIVVDGCNDWWITGIDRKYFKERVGYRISALESEIRRLKGLQDKGYC